MKKLFLFFSAFPFVLLIGLSSHGLVNSQKSYFKTIAIPLDGMLIKGIPHRNRALFKADDLIESSAERSNNFVVQPFAKFLLTELLKSNYNVVVLSNFSDSITQSLLKAIKIEKFANKDLLSLVQVKYVDFSTPLDLAVLGLDESSLVLTQRGVETLTVARNLNLGARYYAFPDFKSASEARSAIKNEIEQAPFFPRDETDWFIENFKLAFAHSALERVLQDSFIASLQGLREVENLNPKELAQEGIDFFEAERTPIRLRLLTDESGSKFVGCEQYVLKTRVKTKVAISECVDKVDGVVFAFKNIKKSICAAYDSELVEITTVDQKRCTDQVVLFNSKANRNIKITAFSGMENLSVEEIFRRYSPPPTSAEPVRLFEPWNNLEKKDHLNLLSCVQLQGGHNTMGFNATTRTMHNECRTDTLYSWGDQTKLDVILGQIGNSNKWAPIKTIFLSRGPISTFGYGPIPIRIKLKKNVAYKAVSFGRCDFSQSEEAKNTVYVRTDGHYMDWSICNPAVIHSWSHSTREHYDEMIKEYEHHDEVLKSRRGLLGLIEIYGSAQQQRTLFGDSIDSRRYTREILISQLLGILNRIEKKLEQIFFNPESPASEKTREAHFQTDYPTYFNER